MLQVIERNNVLLVDSRLIAEELGITHKTLKETISKYTQKLESLASKGFDPVAGTTGTGLVKEMTPKQSDVIVFGL